MIIIIKHQTLRVAGFQNDSITDGPGIRFTVFAQGCYHNCPNCHNPQTHDPLGGKEATIQSIVEELIKNPLLDGLTISGGEPFLQSESFAILASKAKALGLNVITYTGYCFEQLLQNEKHMELVKASDYIVDGLFEQNLKTHEMAFVGSSNQRIIDVQKSLETSTVFKNKL